VKTIAESTSVIFANALNERFTVLPARKTRNWWPIFRYSSSEVKKKYCLHGIKRPFGREAIVLRTGTFVHP
jgi:hypothetical protein